LQRLERAADADRLGTLERAVAVAEDHTEGAVGVRSHDVVASVAEQVADGKETRRGFERDGGGAVEGAVPVAPEHFDGAVNFGGYNVQGRIGALKVPDRHAFHCCANVEHGRRCKARHRPRLQQLQTQPAAPGKS
jgi:hypothetical protein